MRFAPITNQNVVSYTCVVAVNNEDLKLRPGMTATASIITYHGSKPLPNARETDVVVETQDVPRFLTKVAELIGLRAMRRVQRQIRHTLS